MFTILYENHNNKFSKNINIKFDKTNNSNKNIINS